MQDDDIDIQYTPMVGPVWPRGVSAYDKAILLSEEYAKLYKLGLFPISHVEEVTNTSIIVHIVCAEPRVKDND